MSKDNRIDLTAFEGMEEWELPDLIAELKRCYERIDNAETALREIWDHQINNVGGYNITEILQYYKNAYGLNIEPEEQ